MLTDRKMNATLQNLVKCSEANRARKRMPRKPDSLPISSFAEMNDFEAVDDDGFTEVVNYFNYIGGFNLKEAINLCLKEAMIDDITPSFTWWGRKDGPRPLYNARIIVAIYEAVCGNRHFIKPTRSEFQAQMREALRAAKQRCRSKLRGPRIAETNRRMRNFWSDQGLDDIAETAEMAESEETNN